MFSIIFFTNFSNLSLLNLRFQLLQYEIIFAFEIPAAKFVMQEIDAVSIPR